MGISGDCELLRLGSSCVSGDAVVTGLPNEEDKHFSGNVFLCPVLLIDYLSSWKTPVTTHICISYISHFNRELYMCII